MPHVAGKQDPASEDSPGRHVLPVLTAEGAEIAEKRHKRTLFSALSAPSAVLFSSSSLLVFPWRLVGSRLPLRVSEMNSSASR